MLRTVRTVHDADARTLTLVIVDHGAKRMHPLGGGRFFFKDGPQSTARLRRGTQPERDVLTLQRDGTELRYRRAPARVAARTR
jgi:hypothetical protein